MSAPRLSIIVPSRNEQFLRPTILDLLANATGDIEVIQVLDGYYPPDVVIDPRVITLHRGDARGMRPAINDAVQMARGRYLMKLDAHCAIAEGFDDVVLSEIDDDWIVTLRRYALDPERWAIDSSNSKYPVDAHYLSYPYENPTDKTKGLHGTPWTQRREQRKDILLDDEMSSQGSCWVMSRRHWDRLGEMESDKYGNFIHEFQELGLKTWLGGGAVKINKKTWYAHLYKGRKYGRGYILGPQGHLNGSDFTTTYWMNNSWERQVRDMRWLVEKFAPVPTWPTDLDQAFAKATTTQTPKKVWTNTNPRTKAGCKRVDLAALFAANGYTRGAEIGVADGWYSEKLCQLIPGLHLTCVDPWAPYAGNTRGGGKAQHEGNYARVQKRLEAYHVTFLRQLSLDAVATVALASLDFVYIDGNHDYDFVRQDLEAWSARVRPGGIVAGHDFYDFKNSGVIQAVEEFTAAHGITEWWTCDEKEPSFWWVQPDA